MILVLLIGCDEPLVLYEYPCQHQYIYMLIKKRQVGSRQRQVAFFCCAQLLLAYIINSRCHFALQFYKYMTIEKFATLPIKWWENVGPEVFPP